jgi:type VI protein secretion system component VasF
MEKTSDKINRIRRYGPDLSPQWALPAEAAYEMRSDPWMRRLFIAAAVCVAVTLLLLPLCKISLASQVDTIGQISSGARP